VREEHGDHRAIASGFMAAADADRSTILFDQALRNPKPQAGTADAFRGEEWLKDMAKRFRIHA